MSAILGFLLAGVMTSGVAQATAAARQPAGAPVTIAEDDAVEVKNNGQTIRGRIAALTADAVVLHAGDQRMTVPMANVRRIDRIGDSLADGTALGAGLGGATTLGLLAKLCANSNCSDTSTNLDPRVVLLGTVIGGGIGALVDAVFEARTPVYRAEHGQLPVFVPEASGTPRRTSILAFGRVGAGRVDDDEGSLGGGPTAGGGVLVSFTERFGVQVTYDRLMRERNLEYGGGFFGTEQLVTAKAVFLFRPNRPLRPYVAVGLGLLDSERRSQFPTFVAGQQFMPVRGPDEIFRYHTRDRALGFSTGLNARVSRHVAVLGDLTLDVGRTALGSTRLTVGAGWIF